MSINKRNSSGFRYIPFDKTVHLMTLWLNVPHLYNHTVVDEEEMLPAELNIKN